MKLVEETLVVASLTELRNYGNPSDQMPAMVKDTGDLYVFAGSSTATDDGGATIKPTKRGVSDKGRWVRLGSVSDVPLYDPGQRAVNVLRVASAGINAQTVTIGGDVFELATKDSLAVTSGRIAVDVHAGATVKAQGKYTVAGGDAADTETLIVNGKTYTLQATLTNVDGNVKIGATPEDTIDNMVAAINLSAGSGTKYAAAMTAHTTVVASKSSTDKLVLTAIIGGTPGNAYTLAGTAAHWTRDAATMGTLTLGVDPSAENVVDALLAAINASAVEEVGATKISANEMLLHADAVGVVTLACTETLLGSNNAWAAAAMYGGRASAVRKMSVQSRVPLAQEVTLGNMHFKFNFTPTSFLIAVRVTADGTIKAWGGTYVSSTDRLTLVNGTDPDWAATDTVTVVAVQ